MADLVAPGGYNIMVKGEGCYLYDIEGNKYIDALAGLFLKNIGHHHPEVASAVAEQMAALAYTNSGAYSSVPGILLSKKLAELAPGDLNQTFFLRWRLGGGGDCFEASPTVPVHLGAIRKKQSSSLVVGSITAPPRGP